MVAMEKCEPKYEPRCRIFFAEGQKFRTNLLVLFFDLPLKRETATKTALLAEQALQGKELTTERLLRQIERTEAADIVRAAKHFRLQTVYLLQGKERTQDAD